MMLLLFLITAIAMFFVQAMIFKSLPLFIRGPIASLPLLGMIANFLFSGSILVFTGAGAIAGISNMVSSVVLGFYLIAYKKYRKVETTWTWKGWSVFKVPVLHVTEQPATGLLGLIF